MNALGLESVFGSPSNETAEAAGGMAQPPPAALAALLGESPPYLESERTTPEVEVTPTGRLKCKRLGCGSVWCPCGCGMAKGLALRDALRIELESFKSPYFVTLTLEQDQFEDGPEGALGWVQEHGVISEFVRHLRRGGHLLDSRYVVVMEFQANGWPHWHLIFDASFVPFPDICEAWASAGWAGSRGRQRWGERPRFSGKGQKPVFGGVRFRSNGREELGRICHYLTKYVTKMPVEGWPKWVLLTQRQLRRWSTSRDFWRTAVPPKTATKVTEFSKLRDKYFDPDDEWEEDGECLTRVGKIKRSIGQRLDTCGCSSVVLEEVEVPAASSGERATLKWRWVGMIPADVWRDPHTDKPVFKLDELGPTSFVVNDPDGVLILRQLSGGDV